MTTGPETAELPTIVALLSDALAMADRAKETLLGAKIDDALECARAALSRAG